MPAAVIDLNKTEDERDVVHRAVQALAEGKIVAFPTETVYGLAASALHEKAVHRLAELKGRQAGHPFSLAITGADAALDYCPQMSVVGQRLTRRCWPGPVTLVFDVDHPDSAMTRLPESVRTAVAPQGTVGLRVPAHKFPLSVLDLLAGPIALTSANRSGEADATTGRQVADIFGDEVDLILDGGPCKYSQPSSVVRVHENQFQVLRNGVVSEASLQRCASLLVLIVCTGNTCRSPMAEVMMQKRLAERLGCPIEELEQHGCMVLSAGVAAMTGGHPSPEAVTAMQQRGLDLSKHESQPLTDVLVRFADVILTMTGGHRDAILQQWPNAAGKVEKLCGDSGDVYDPIGGPLEAYVRCADQIDSHLEGWVARIDVRDLPATN